MEKVCLCGFERDTASETRQKHCLLQLAGPNETEARMSRKASETDVDHKVMDGVTSNRGREPRGSHLNGSDSEHPYARDARKARHVGRPSWCNVVHSVAQETEDEDVKQTRGRERKRYLTMTFSVSRPRWPCRRRSEPDWARSRWEEERRAGELDSIGCGARIPGMGFRGPSRRFIMKIISLGSGACELLAAD